MGTIRNIKEYRETQQRVMNCYTCQGNPNSLFRQDVDPSDINECNLSCFWGTSLGPKLFPFSCTYFY